MLGLAILLIGLIVFGLYAWRDKRRKAVHIEEFPEDITETDYGVPRVLVIVYIAVAAGMLGHVLYVWLKNVSY